MATTAVAYEGCNNLLCCTCVADLICRPTPVNTHTRTCYVVDKPIVVVVVTNLIYYSICFFFAKTLPESHVVGNQPYVVGNNLNRN